MIGDIKKFAGKEYQLYSYQSSKELAGMTARTLRGQGGRVSVQKVGKPQYYGDNYAVYVMV